MHTGILDGELFNPNYSVYRKDRHGLQLNSKVGGGVLISVSNRIPSQVIDLDGFTDLEIVCVRVDVPNKKLNIINLYIKPNSCPDVYARYVAAVEEVLDKCNEEDDALIVGDFNLPSLKWLLSDEEMFYEAANVTHDLESHLIDSFSAYHLQQMNGVSNMRGRMLDLAFSTDVDSTFVDRCTSPILHEVCDHPSINITYDILALPSDKNCPNIYNFNFRKADYLSLDNYLSSIDWSTLFQGSTDINAIVLIFYRVLFDGFTLFVPVTRKRNFVLSPPWYDDEIRKIRNRRNSAWKRFNHTKLDNDYQSYSDLRKLFQSYAKTLYDAYIQKVQENIKSNPSAFWDFVNAKRKSNGYPKSLTFAEKSSQDPAEISNMFAEFFATSYLDSSNDIDWDFFNESFEPFRAFSSNIAAVYLKENVVLDFISKIDEGYSICPDGVPSAVLTKCSNSLSSPLTYIFNLSLENADFPDIWKKSYVTPIHKKGRKNLIENYRPIAKLSPIPKLFEAIICDSLSFQCRHLISKNQHGFVRNRSTVTNVVEFTNHCISSMEDGFQVDTIYTDFSKAFDRLSHQVLIYKLKLLGFSSNLSKWIRSYLEGRSLQVSFNSTLSASFGASSGVPQGSHLGPLLFVLFINDLFTTLSDSNVLCYADDAKIFKTIKNSHDAYLLQQDLDKFSKWCDKNLLSINVSKCVHISFTRKRKPFIHKYYLNRSLVPENDNVNDLGIALDKKLTFCLHINIIIQRANSKLGYIKRWSKDIRDPYVLKILFCSFVRSILEYACVVWSPFYSIHSNRLESVQKRFLRFALRNLPWNDSLILPPYSTRLELIKMTSLKKRRESHGVLFIYKLLSGSIDSENLLSLVSINSRPRTVRANKFLYTGSHRTNYGLYEPMSAMCTNFNKNFDKIDFDTNASKIKCLLNS